MSSRERYLLSALKRDLTKKMVFLGGPRQVGKTTLARRLLGSEPGYLNWDYPEDREKILRMRFPDNKLWVFDELHKYRKWRQFLKGLYDKDGNKHSILVTGSARLDYYRYGGDSLQGRYHYWRLHPLSVSELKMERQKDLETLLRIGGFPEPFFEGSEVNAKRWSREYRTRLIQDDILGVEQIKDIGTMEMLVLRLPELVGSPLSVNSLKEDLQLNHATVERWLTLLERMYAIFRVSPFGPPNIRAVKKERKHYHLDWTLVKEPGYMFENMIAVHLLKWTHFLQDAEGREMELRYFRMRDGREIDFILMEDGKPLMAVECKLKERNPSRTLVEFKRRYKSCECVQVILDETDPVVTSEGVRVESALSFLARFV